MQLKENTSRCVALLGIVFSVIFARLILLPLFGQPLSMSPVEPIALFSGAYLSNKRWAPFAVTLLSVWISDLAINRFYLGHWTLFYSGFYWQYGSLCLITLIGMMLKNRVTCFTVGAASLSSAILFFTISNFGFWISGLLYPLTKEGLMLCYVAAIPFFRYELLSYLVYGTLLFGSFEWMQKRFFVRSASFKSSIT